jgi:hypothetical protein
MEQLTMSNRDVDKLRVIRNTIESVLTWQQASGQLSVSIRQIGRLCKKVRMFGNKGIIHGLRGKISNNHIDESLINEAIEIIKSRYIDFGSTFANEKLCQNHGMKLSVSTLRKAMIKEGIYSSRKSKSKHRIWRQRRACVGELVQLDGSDHDWFEGRCVRCVLLIYIDDATSKILYAEFIPVEDTENLMLCTRKYLLLHGRPISFYVDKDSIYKVNRQATIEEELKDSQVLTQFTRAMKELDIKIIPANSPQAKGRVERGFGTHQDRLVKEMRLANISDISSANEFLSQKYVPTHNAKYAVEPANKHNAHRKLLPSHKLNEILSIRTERTIANDYTVRLQNKYFQLLAEQPVRISPKIKIVIEKWLDDSIHLKYKDKQLNFKILPQRPYRAYYAFKKPVVSLTVVRAYKPPMNHPWRRYEQVSKCR